MLSGWLEPPSRRNTTWWRRMCQRSFAACVWGTCGNGRPQSQQRPRCRRHISARRIGVSPAGWRAVRRAPRGPPGERSEAADQRAAAAAVAGGNLVEAGDVAGLVAQLGVVADLGDRVVAHLRWPAFAGGLPCLQVLEDLPDELHVSFHLAGGPFPLAKAPGTVTVWLGHGPDPITACRRASAAAARSAPRRGGTTRGTTPRRSP